MTYRAAVEISGCGNFATNNLIHDAPHNAILFGGNDHDISYNEIHHVCLQTSDAGAIYTGRDWGYRGNTLRYNYIHDLTNMYNSSNYYVQGIYIDDCTSLITLNNNDISFF